MLLPGKTGERYDLPFFPENVLKNIYLFIKEDMENRKLTPETLPVNVLEEAAQDLGIKGFVFPKVGTEAYSRLVSACRNYSQEVFLEMTVSHRRDMASSQSRRRRFHNQLCIMILGLEHAAVREQDPKNLQRVANLAHMVSGREQYIEEV